MHVCVLQFIDFEVNNTIGLGMWVFLQHVLTLSSWGNNIPFFGFFWYDINTPQDEQSRLNKGSVGSIGVPNYQMGHHLTTLWQ